MNILDIILLVCLIPAVFQGLNKGFIHQVLAIIAIIVGGWSAYHFSNVLSGYISSLVEIHGTALQIVSFIVIFATAAVLLMLLAKMLEAIIRIILLDWLNKLLGLIFAIFKFVLIIGILIVFFDAVNGKFGLVSETWLSDSFMYTGIRHTAYAVFPYLKQLLF